VTGRLTGKITKGGGEWGRVSREKEREKPTGRRKKIFKVLPPRLTKKKLGH